MSFLQENRAFILSAMERNNEKGIESFFPDDKVPWVFIVENADFHISAFLDDNGDAFVKTLREGWVIRHNGENKIHWDVRILKVNTFSGFLASLEREQ